MKVIINSEDNTYVKTIIFEKLFFPFNGKKFSEKKKGLLIIGALPKVNNKTILVLDPMLATGNSSSAAIDLIKERGVKVKNIKLVSLLAAPEGIKNLHKKHKDLHIFTCSLDRGLNKKKYIVPGLGDAGDRYMGT